MFQISGGGETVNPHHKRHRRLQPPAAESDQIEDRVPNRRQPPEDAVPGDHGHHVKNVALLIIPNTIHLQDISYQTPAPSHGEFSKRSLSLAPSFIPLAK